MNDGAHVRQIRVIGIGMGAENHLTLQAINAMREVDVFLVADKGEQKAQLVRAREELCAAVLEPGSYEFVQLPDPVRGPDAERTTTEYTSGVVDWHTARARAWARCIDALPAEGVVGFLVWGDPAFYDSTIRIAERMRAFLPLDMTVVPGISAFQALAAEHRMVLHAIGQPVHVTTGRRLVEEWKPELGAVVVMLDGHLACQNMVEAHPDLTIHWGAYLGLPQQVLRAGRLADVIDELLVLRASLREEHGWIMDVYSLS